MSNRTVKERQQIHARARNFLRDFDPGKHPKDELGRWAETGGGDGADEDVVGTVGPRDPNNYGLVPGDAEKFHALKSEWAKVNNGLLAHVDHPDGPESQAGLRKLEAISKQIQTLHADPGTPAGIGLPGGPRDVVIVGAGPGGLAASINGAAEGLDTLVVEANIVAGGQAKMSSRIENFPGFPIGVTGQRLTQSMFTQAERLGASTKLGTRVVGMTYEASTGMKHLKLSDGQVIITRTVIVAGGLEARPLQFPGADGPGVINGDGKALAEAGKGGVVCVIGGSNGAAQAALGCAPTCAHVFLIARTTITKDMSAYQREAVQNNPKITVIENDSVAKLNRDENNQPVSIETASGQTLEINALGAFIGSIPKTDWVDPKIVREKGGRIETDEKLQAQIPGVYAVGDVRAGAIGRIGVAVGEGQLALREANGYLLELQKQAGIEPKSLRVVRAKTSHKTEMLSFITQLFALDRENAWFGQTVEDENPPEETGKKKMSKGYTTKQRMKIHAHGKRVLNKLIGKQDDANDRFIFMSQCVENLVSSGEAEDEDRAAQICNLLWDEGEADYY